MGDFMYDYVWCSVSRPWKLSSNICQCLNSLCQTFQKVFSYPSGSMPGLDTIQDISTWRVLGLVPGRSSFFYPEFLEVSTRAHPPSGLQPRRDIQSTAARKTAMIEKRAAHMAIDASFFLPKGSWAQRKSQRKKQYTWVTMKIFGKVS